MQKFIHNIALMASLIVLTCGLWQDWPVWLTVKRMIISYLGFFFCGSGLFLAFKAVQLLEPKHVKTGNNKAVGNRPTGR